MRIFVIRRQWWTTGLCLCFAVGLFWLVSHPAAIGAAAVRRELPIYSVGVSEDDKRIAISFDAAWGNEDTQNLIDILGKYNVPATFFVVGEWVDKYPDSVRALSDAGHDIMNHSDTHPDLTKLSSQAILNELEGCNNKVEGVTGVRPTLHRCPYGAYDDHVIQAVRSIGMEPIQWDVDSLDWKGLSASEIAQRVVERVQPGSIVLFHNAAEHTPEALPGIIENLQSQGYTFVKIADLIVDGEYTIDVNGTQHPKEDAALTNSSEGVS